MNADEGPRPRYAPALYSVVVSPNRTIDEAKTLQSRADVWPSTAANTGMLDECGKGARFHSTGSWLPNNIYILKQRLWHQDQYAEVYFFAHEPWTDEEIKGDNFLKSISNIDPTAYVEMNLHNQESFLLPFIGTNASFSLKMHRVKSYADVTICLN